MSVVKYKQSTSILCLIVLFTSCEYINNLMGNDEIIHETQTVGQITSIVVDAPVRLVLHNRETNEAMIKGGNRLVENLLLSVDDGILYIEHEKKNYLQKSKLIELGLSANYISKITANMAFELIAPERIVSESFAMVVNGGAKFAEIELNLECNNISLNVYGNNNIGNFYLGGTANKGSFTLEGSVNINALDLDCQDVNVKHKSIGSCKVHAQSKLNVTTYSSGDTYYKGSPIIHHQKVQVPYLNCSGKLIQID
ncbi:GIN domain-containing protein [Carboxylicivirga marina]|uniref:GIN domain-containing protein n=1 Tax=Carboxylicivirga marina TaxID=2800988 RepID=UPI002597B047|nr:DUF2807 domain-containing protein [uncultured Carboxylicivirga sp.]